ncbi:MAG: cyclic nucleotide-binding domain-containing protein [Desulfobulbus sp.]|jgi:hypothetical protein
MTSASSLPSPALQTASHLDFPMRFYTALRTSRLYPVTNPQVARNNRLVMQSIASLRLIHGDRPISLAVATDQTLLVCGHQLSEKDQLRPQIQGLVALFNRLTLYSLAFTASFSPEDCTTLIQILSPFLDQSHPPSPIGDLLSQAGLQSIQTDTKRYVAVSEGDQLLAGDLIAGADPLQQADTSTLSGTNTGAFASDIPNAEEIVDMALDFLLELAQEENPEQRAAKIDTAALAFADIDLFRLACLLTDLPESSEADQLLQAVLRQVDSERCTSLAAHLAMLRAAREPESSGAETDDQGWLNRLHRLLGLDEEQRKATGRIAAQHTDACLLLHTQPGPETRELPPSLSTRLQSPEWAAEVLAAAVQQWIDHDMHQEIRPVGEQSVYRLLNQYEILFDQEQQSEVARQAGERLAALEGETLGALLAQKFQGLFGEQLYRQVLTQTSDILLDQAIDHLTPAQLNRMVAVLISDVPMQVGREADENFQEADDELFKRLAHTASGPRCEAILRQHREALRWLWAETETAQELSKTDQWPYSPEETAAVLAAALHQAADPGLADRQGISRDQVDQMIVQLGDALPADQHHHTADLTAEQISELDNLPLAILLTWRFPSLFGKHLNRSLDTRISAARLNLLIDGLSVDQLGQVIASAWKEQDPAATNDTNPFPPDSLLGRLLLLSRRQEVVQRIAQHADARRMAALAPGEELPAELRQRLQQPDWAAAVITAAIQQEVGAETTPGEPQAPGFSRVIDQIATRLTGDQQEQAASAAGATLAGLEHLVLTRFLREQPRSDLGNTLHRQVMDRLSENQLRHILTGLAPYEADDRREPLREETPSTGDGRTRRDLLIEKMQTLFALRRKHQDMERQKRQAALRQAVQRLLAGDESVLEDPALLQTLPELIGRLLDAGHQQQVDTLLVRLIAALRHREPPEQHLRVFRTLAAAALQLAHKNEWQRLDRLAPILCRGLQHMSPDADAARSTCSAVALLAKHHILASEYKAAADAVSRLYSLATDPAIAAATELPILAQCAREALYGICTQPVLQHLLDAYLEPEQPQELIARIFRHLGPESIRFQVQQLINSQSRFERMRLLVLIRQAGPPAIDLLKQHLGKDAPWFVLRNIIRLIGDIGSPEHLPLVRPYIAHADLRVQQEVITSAIKLGGNDLKDFLLEALHQVDDNLKARLISHMATTHDERFVRPLTDLLESRQPFSGKNKTELHLTICRVLGAIGSKRATTALERIAQSNPFLGLMGVGYGEEVLQEAARTLDLIRNGAASIEEQPQPDPEPTAAHTSSAPDATKPDTADEEAAIFALAEQGHQTQAMERLIALIGATVKTGDFKNAERLRDRIYEINSMPLSEVIRATDLIDQARQGTVKGEDLEIWSDLTDRLSNEEFLAVYHGFVERSYKAEEPLVVQDDKNDTLFFINQGSVKVSHMAGPREIFITTLTRGQIAGENFFTPSVWTYSLTALSPTKVYVLPQAAMKGWDQQFPGLHSKLQDYYTANNNIPAILEQKGLDRRVNPRYLLSRKIQVQPITSQGQPVGKPFYADMADISQGGLAFLVRISRKENARLLLGRTMQVLLPVGGKVEYCRLKGMVIGIQPFQLLDNDFSVHMKFDQPLAADELQNVLG